MVKRAGSTRLLFKAPQSIFINGEGRRNYFDRDVATQLRIARSVNLAHSSGTELGTDFITTEFCADAQTHFFELLD
jgi:hypothetical protein